MKKPVLVSWSSGKDSAWALHLLRSGHEFEPVRLVTTVNAIHHRVAVHGVRQKLLEQQAQAAGLPLETVPLPHPCSNADYEAAMRSVTKRAERENIRHFAFGDLFLTDIRAYREAQLANTNVAPMFPVWGAPTGELAQQMLAAGVRAVLTCVDTRVLPVTFAGREFDAQLLDELPDGVDPCGERGEFHTFVYASPAFSNRVRIRIGETIVRDGFAFADVVPA